MQLEDGSIIGTLCSGGFSPTLDCSIGQAYLPIKHSELGTSVYVNVRGRKLEAIISDMPFVEPKTKSYPLIGREYEFGVKDCFEALRDYLKSKNHKLYYSSEALCYHLQDDDAKSLSKRYWSNFKKTTFAKI